MRTSHQISARACLVSIVLLIIAVFLMRGPTPAAAFSTKTVASTTTPYDWLQFGFDEQHSSNNTLETTISAANVATLKPLFVAKLPDIVVGTPVYLSQVSTPGGTQDLVFSLGKAGTIMASNAHTGAMVWSKQYPAGTCTFANPTTPCYTTAAPAIDPNRQYVYAYGLDGYIHKYQVGDGTEIKTGGWPEVTTAKDFEKVSTSLAFATVNGNTYLYQGHSSKQDLGDYQGHLTTINLGTGTQHVFNTVCSNQVDVYFVLSPGTPDCPVTEAGIWARTAAVFDPDTGRLYISTGNGSYSPSQFYWGFSVLALNPDGTSNAGVPLDSWTPTNYATMKDHDVGSTSLGILPAPGSSIVKHLGVQSGKDGLLRLLNLDNLSGQGGPGHTGGELQKLNLPQGNEVLSSPAVWVNPADGTTWVFYANVNGISGLQLTVNSSGAPSLSPKWLISSSVTGRASPMMANNVLFVASTNLLQAFDPTTGTVLWSSTAMGGVHHQSPIIANGVLYVTDENHRLRAFSPQ